MLSPEEGQIQYQMKFEPLFKMCLWFHIPSQSLTPISILKSQ